MRVAYVYDAIARIGGVERILVDKMNYLAEVYGYEVYLITYIQGLHPFSFPLSNKVKHIDINVPFHSQYQYKYFKQLWLKWQLRRQFQHRLAKAIEHIDPDIIIGTTYYKADVICQLKCRAKKIIESHCAKSYTGKNDGIQRNKLVQWIYSRQLAEYNRTIEKKSDMIIALTTDDAKEWNAKNTIIIPNMILQLPKAKSSCESHRVISVGRLDYQKGHDRLIEAWKQVHAKYPHWTLDIFGEGTRQKMLEKQIKENHLEKVVTLHPFTANIINEYLNSSILALSSNYEGFGLVLIEAMGCGIPCISFNCPNGPSDIITDKEDGILIPNGDIKKMAEALCHLIENENIRKEYGAKAKENIKRFLPEVIMPKWNELFHRLTQQTI